MNRELIKSEELRRILRFLEVYVLLKMDF